MENSPNHQIRSEVNPLREVLRWNIQCHIQQISSECQLVLFRNDLPDANPPKSTQQKSLEEHMRRRRRFEKWSKVQKSTQQDSSQICGSQMWDNETIFSHKGTQKRTKSHSKSRINNWHTKYIQSNSERINGLCREARMLRNEMIYLTRLAK